VEVALGVRDGELRLLRNGTEVLKTKVPAERAVIFLPPGDYTAEITAAGKTRREPVHPTQTSHPKP
jgi:hypothetical protein